MDLARVGYSIHESKTLSPVASPSIFSNPDAHNTSGTSFPIIAVAVIGILATAFLLVSYYVFVIKCCLSWHRIDLLRRFSLSQRRNTVDPLMTYSPRVINRGLDESVIRSIPIFQFKKQEKPRDFGGKSFCECAVCLNEFEDDEKLRIIPNCAHVFHIDCIDIWLQNNSNCPLCRTSVSDPANARFSVEQVPGPRSTPQDLSPYQENVVRGEEGFVVIELGQNNPVEQTLRAAQERLASSHEEPSPTSPRPWRTEPRTLGHNKGRKFHKGTSMGDEVIDVIRGKDERFEVQPMRRSISMDSSADRTLLLAVQEAVQRRDLRDGTAGGPVEGCASRFGNSGRVRRSFFSFGSGRGSRSAVLPVHADP